MKIKMLQVNEIIPYFRNAKRHPEEQIASLAKQIEEVGFTQPLVVDTAKNLVIGHGRLEAAKLLNMSEVPVVVLDESLSDERIAALRIYDNKVSETGWDTLKLIEEFTELKEFDFDLSLTGFAEYEINAMLDVNLEDVGFEIPAEDKKESAAESAPSEGFKQVQLLYKPDEHRTYLDCIERYKSLYDCKDQTSAEIVLLALRRCVEVDGEGE